MMSFSTGDAGQSPPCFLVLLQVVVPVSCLDQEVAQLEGMCPFQCTETLQLINVQVNEVHVTQDYFNTNYCHSPTTTTTPTTEQP